MDEVSSSYFAPTEWVKFVLGDVMRTFQNLLKVPAEGYIGRNALKCFVNFFIETTYWQ